MLMGLGLKERIELMRQGIIQRYIVPMLEMHGYMVSEWKRPISLEDMILRDEGWMPQYTQFTTWETYTRTPPLHIYFNTFAGDVFEKAYKFCFVEFLIPWINYKLPPNLIGMFTRLNLKNGGYIWKNKIILDLSNLEVSVREIERNYDDLVLKLVESGIIKD